MPKKYFYSKKEKKINIRKSLKLVGAFLIASGLVFIFYFFFPIISWQVYYASVFASSNLEVPIPKYLVNNTSGNFTGYIFNRLNSITTNSTDARNWYPQLGWDLNKGSKVESYNLSIPKLKIENAVVSTTNYELSKHLVQYWGTTTPPENGTTVIFGHSSLPQMFNPKDYKTIFATLHNLRNGDEIIINSQGITYKYKIFSITITDPDDVNIFSQSYDDSYIALVTCTPPGTTWKRLIVRAKLTK